MDDIIKYIKKYGDKTFDEEKCNEVDILIFSQITYIDFNYLGEVTLDKGIKLCEAWRKVKNNNKIPKCITHKHAIKMMDLLCEKKRFKDLLLYNYDYKFTDNTQFGALTLKDSSNQVYVCFEGTDDTVSGWKEDFALTYTYPTEAQEMAKYYLKKIISKFKRNVIVCGHSKGGNLALVASMRINVFQKFNIKKIYSFDGPGLKINEFNSLNYKLVRKKLINIIPNKSIIGVLLEQENVDVVKSKAFGVMQHIPNTWVINDKMLERCEQDNISKSFDETINNWLIRYNYEERKYIVENVFKLFEDANIKSFNDIKITKFANLKALLRESQDMSLETKNVILSSLKLLFTEIGNDIIDEGKDFIQTKIGIKNQVPKK